MDRLATKLLLDVAAEGLYESLHRNDFGAVRFADIPDDERAIWKEEAAKWIKNFLTASHDLVTADVTRYLEEVVLKQEFPIDSHSQLMVVRSEVLLNALKKYGNKSK